MNKVEIFENERAKGYDKFVETWIPNYHYFLDQLPKLLQGIDLKKLLVVGCGTGNEIERFLHATEQWKIFGVDPSSEMIEQARKKLQDHKNVELLQGVITDINVNNKYGAATLLLVLHFLDDDGSKLNLLKNIAEKLVSGASFVILDITGNKSQITGNLNILKCFLPQGMDDEQVNSRISRIKNELHHVSEERLCELCLEAGFEPPLRFFQSSIYMGWLTKKK